MEENKKKKDGLFPGTFVAARKIINRGEISSEGPEARTEIITEDYRGNGIIKSKITKNEECKREQPEEIFKLEPELYGIGIKLKPLFNFNLRLGEFEEVKRGNNEQKTVNKLCRSLGCDRADGLYELCRAQERTSQIDA